MWSFPYSASVVKETDWPHYDVWQTLLETDLANWVHTVSKNGRIWCTYDLVHSNVKLFAIKFVGAAVKKIFSDRPYSSFIFLSINIAHIVYNAVDALLHKTTANMTNNLFRRLGRTQNDCIFNIISACSNSTVWLCQLNTSWPNHRCFN